MNIQIKFTYLVLLVVASLSSVSVFAQQARQTTDAAQSKKDYAALRACQADCKKTDGKDAERFETCMIKCNKQWPAEAGRYRKRGEPLTRP